MFNTRGMIAEKVRPRWSCVTKALVDNLYHDVKDVIFDKTRDVALWRTEDCTASVMTPAMSVCKTLSL